LAIPPRKHETSGPSAGIHFTYKLEAVMDAIFKYGEAHTAFGGSGGLRAGNSMQLVRMTDPHLNRIFQTLTELKKGRAQIEFSGPELVGMLDIFDRKASLFEEHKALLISIDNADRQLASLHQAIKQAIRDDMWKLKDDRERERINVTAQRKQMLQRLVNNQNRNIDLNEPSMNAVRSFVNALAVKYPDMHEEFGSK